MLVSIGLLEEGSLRIDLEVSLGVKCVLGVGIDLGRSGILWLGGMGYTRIIQDR